MRLVRGIVLVVLLASIGLAQTNNTVYQVLNTNYSTASSYTSGAVVNIGQSSHSFSYVFSDKAPGTCTRIDQANNIDVLFAADYSWDNAVWVRGPFSVVSAVPGTVATNRLSVLLFGSVVAPFVRTRMGTFDNTNCQVTVSYSGSVYPFNIPVIPFIGGIYGSLVNNTVHFAGAGTQTIISQTFGGSNYWKYLVYSISVTNEDAAALATVAINTVFNDGVTSAPIVTLKIPANQTLTYNAATNGTPIFTTQIMGAISATSDKAVDVYVLAGRGN